MSTMRIWVWVLLFSSSLSLASDPAVAQSSSGATVSPDGRVYLVSKDQPVPGGFERWTVALNLAADGSPVNVTGNVLRGNGEAIFVSCQFRDPANLNLRDPSARVPLRCRTAPPCDATAESCARADWLESPSIDVEVSVSFFLPDGTSGGGFLPPTPPNAERGATLTEDARSFVVSKDLSGKRWSIVLNRAPADGSGPPPFTSLTGNVFQTNGGSPEFVFCDARTLTEADLLARDRSVRLPCQFSSPCDGNPEECASRWSGIGEADVPVSFLLPDDGLRRNRGFKDSGCVTENPCLAGPADSTSDGARVAQDACRTGSPCTLTLDQCGTREGVLVQAGEECLCEVSLAGSECLRCSRLGTACEISVDGEVLGEGVCQPETSSGRPSCAPPDAADTRGCGGVNDLGCERSGTCCADDRSDGCDPNAGGLDCAGLCVAGASSSGLCGELEDARTCTGLGRDPGEECDGADLAGKTCADLGFGGGELRCIACRFDTSGCFAGGFCGDGVVQAPEACDDGNGADTDACKSDCTANVCGDGIRGPGEGCDDGNGVDGDDCRNDCMPARCGDALPQPPEECDDGNANPADACTNECTLPRCTDGIVQAGEQCDDGNAVPDDGCTNGCEVARCGDGILQPPELCDDGNQSDADDCSSGCFPTECGDATVQAGEQCDDGNVVDTDPCRNDCTTNVCGDGIAGGEGEACDDGNAVNDDACKNDCTANVCGDGVAGGRNEECDDGNGINEDACRSDCGLNFCGDGVPGGPAEECDDANAVDADACRNGCILNVCGDDVSGGPGEQCDDGNTVETDGCSSTCQLTGTVAVNLTWDLPVDLDLYLELPDGTTITYFNPSAQGGSLDADDVCSTVATTDGDETITFPTNAPVGTYTVLVDLFSLCGTGLEEDLPFSFTATVNGEIVRQGDGAVPEGATSPIELVTFEVP